MLRMRGCSARTSAAELEADLLLTSLSDHQQVGRGAAGRMRTMLERIQPL